MICKILNRLVAVCLLLCAAMPAAARWVYFDNSTEKWQQPYIHYWGGNPSTDWPSVAMEKSDYQDIWGFDLPDSATGIIFNVGSNQQQTGNLTPAENHVYTRSGDSNETLEEYVVSHNIPLNTDPAPDSDPNTTPDPDPDTESVYAYADIPDTWTDMYAYVYIDNNTRNANWPGVAMTKDADTGYWMYEVPEQFRSNGLVIFSSKTNSSNRYPADGAPGLPLEGKTHIYRYDGTIWEEYSPVIPDPGENITYTIHFHNNVRWDNVHVRISGVNPQIDMQMASNLNSSIYDCSFEAPENASLYCRFYNIAGGTEQNLTPAYRVIEGHVYTISGDKGLLSEYDPTTPTHESTYWIEPENPTVLQEATLYYDKAYGSDRPLADTDDIYAHIGLLTPSDPNQYWPAISDWENMTDKFKMTPVEEGSSIYKLEFTPTIAEWFGKNAEDGYNRIGVVFRDKNASKQTSDIFINLRVLPPVGEGLGAAQSYETADDGTVTITCERGELMLTPWADNIVKVLTLRSTASNRQERASISVIGNDEKSLYGIEPARFTTTETDTHYIFAIPEGVTVKVEKTTSLLTFFNEGASEATLAELGGLTNKAGNVSVTFQGMDDAGFYGGGYNGNLVNWEGQGMVMNNNQDGNWGQGGSTTRNICIPFYVSTSGYGVYFDDHYRNAKIYPSRNGSTYSSGSTDPIAYYYIGGGSMQSVMENYTTLTGRQELPPYWALGYLTSKYSFATRDEAEQAISRTKDIDIPVDGIIFDIHWQTDYRLRNGSPAGTPGMGKLDWSDAYPNPQEMLSNFRAQNIHTIAITEPFFTSNCGNYDYLKNNSYLADDHVENMQWLRSDHVGLLDITNQGAIDWFKSKYKARTAEGIESWWLDLGEPERHDGDSHYADGSSVDQMNNEYGNRWTRVAYEAMKEQTPDTRFITMPRAGTSGMQRFNAFPWTGDIARSWSGLAAQVPALVSAAMSGVSYLGSDIGGFSSTGTDANLYRRWVQLGVFYPSMRTHSEDRPEVWQEVYSGVRDDVRDAINLRYAYLPYTYSQSYAYTSHGTPIARPANFDDDDKSVLSNEIGAYYWGPDIFVAPVLDNSTSKRITFPEGDWLDMTDFTTYYPGHRSVTYDAPTSKLPRFMRRGAFVTRYRQDKFTSTAEIETGKITVDHFAGRTGDENGSSFYDDDHLDVNAIRDGKYVLTHFSSDNATDAMMINIEREGNGWEGMSATQDILLRIHDFKLTDNGSALTPEMVRLHTFSPDPKSEVPERAVAMTTPFTQMASEDAVRTATTPAYYHDLNGHMYIRLPEAASLGRYTIELGQSGILTGIDRPAALGTMTLAYGGGMLSYSAPEGTKDLRIEVYSATGSMAALYDGLSADGYVAQQSVSLPAGVYIARLSGRNSAGETAHKTVKMIVR